MNKFLNCRYCICSPLISPLFLLFFCFVSALLLHGFCFICFSLRSFLSGSMMCMSVMAQLELPHVSILSKCDLLPDKSALDNVLEPDTHSLLQSLNCMSHSALALTSHSNKHHYTAVTLPHFICRRRCCDMVWKHIAHNRCAR